LQIALHRDDTVPVRYFSVYRLMSSAGGPGATSRGTRNRVGTSTGRPPRGRSPPRRMPGAGEATYI
jgi:hypothetical protein